MVTTRNRAVLAAEGETVVVHTPGSSSRKRTRKPKGEDSPMDSEDSAVKRQRILPVRERDEPPSSSSRSRFAVEIPVKTLKDKNATPSKVSKEVVTIENDVVVGINIGGVNFGGGEQSDDGGEALALPVVHKKDNTPKSAKTKHKRFGSEDLDEDVNEGDTEFFSAALEIPETDEESSDDDAPEVVGAQAALESTKLKSRSAVEAIER